MLFDPKRFPNIRLPPLPFENVEYELRITYTLETDKRIMSFVDILWGFEVTGGIDQYEPLTVIGVNRSGYARRAGIRVNDIITRINDTFAHTLTLQEAQLLIRRSGKYVRIYVQGNDDEDTDDEFTVDFWFTPPKRKPPVFHNKWTGNFPWNDRKKPIYKESNCFMVPSKAEEHIIERMLNRKEPIEVTESNDNVIDTSEDLLEAKNKLEAQNKI